MRKTYFSGILITALVLGMFFVSDADAQWTSYQQPQKATPVTIATLYHILQRKLPNFTEWAKETEAYKSASGFDKNIVLENQVENLKSQFRLVSLTEPIVVESRVRLSEYSTARNGYLVDGFNKDTFFAYEFAGENYAVVVPDIALYEWLPAEGRAAEMIEAAARKSRSRTLEARVRIMPTFADAKPITIKGQTYRLLSGKIRTVELYEPGQPSPVWFKNSAETEAQAQQELLNLYR